MKKVILSFFFSLSVIFSQAQIVALGIAPAGAQGEYAHSWAKPSSGWGTPDFNIPGTYVQGDLILVNDGTPGTNATYGNLLSEEGCNPSPANAYAGKICVIRRNTCEFGQKALEAQNAGAIGVIIVNRDPDVFDMGAGQVGSSVTIPVVMLSNGDGNYLISLMQSNTVNMLLGNIQGVFAYNLAIKNSTTLVPKRGMTPAVIAQNGGEFNFDVGTKIYNYGNQAQTGVSLNVQVKNPNNVTVYNQTVSNISIASADSFTVVPGTLPSFQLASYMNGQYQLIYTISASNTDAYSFDNSLTYYFAVNNDIYSYAGPNAISGLPENDIHYNPLNSFWEHKMCNVITDPNASRMAVQGFHFSAESDAGFDLTGTEIYIELLKWDDQFTDLNDPNFALNNTNLLASGYYLFPANLQSAMVYAPLDSPVALDDNQRYLACVTNWYNEVYLSYTQKVDYTENANLLSQPLHITYVDGSPIVNPPVTSWGVPGLGVKVYNCPTALTQTVNATSCASYTSASGQVYTQSGTYEESIPNIYGCDSIVTTYNLTINAADYLGTSYSVVSPSCTSPSDGSITVTLNSSGLVAGDYILISEYYSGSGSSKAVEIYNASNHSWNLDGTTYDPSSGYTIGNWRLRNNAGAIFTFPANTVIPPYSTLVIKNPFATGLFSNYSSNVIDGSTMTLMVNLDPNDGSPTYDYDMDIATPVAGQTIIRDQSAVLPNFGTPNPGEWNTFPLSSGTLGSHFNATPAGYSILWADGTAGPTLSNIAPGTYEYSVVHSSSGCVIPESPIVLNGYIYNSFSATICDGESYNWNGELYTTPGQYTQTLISQFGCDSVVTLTLNVNYNDVIAIQPSVSFGNAPLNVAFSNQTANMSNYNFTWYFGDGSSQPNNDPFLSHIYTQSGYADVTVVAENLLNGCTSTTTFDNLIFVLGGWNCTHIAAIDTTGPISTCIGDSLFLQCNTDPSFTYQWNRNGVPLTGATGSSFMPVLSGVYTVTIYQNNCPVTSSGISVTVNPQPAVPVISSSGTINSCAGGSVTLSVPAIYQSYSWSNGSNGNSSTVNQSGNYSVSITNSYGCSSTSLPYVVNASFMQAPEICIVGMDSLTNVNRVIWEKPLTDGIDSFYVYRETNVANVYVKIGATDYNELAVYLDPNSNPAVQAYRYKLSVLDTCGTETPLSNFHKTIHLTINAGVGGAWNLIWSHYEGITFGSYNIYRGTDPSNMTLLTTIQSNLNSYSDLTPPSGAVYYQIEIVNPTSCDPQKSVNYGNSRSNIVYNGLNDLSEVVNGPKVTVYPNPAEKVLTVVLPTELVGYQFELVDCSGRKVRTGWFTQSKTELLLDEMERGTYYLRITGYPSVFKVIKQ